MKVPIVSTALPTAQLSNQEVLEMYSLFQNFYDLTTLEIFTDDLSNKNWIVVLKKTKDQHIIGFSSFSIYASTVDGKPIGIVYSGDTIIDKEFWGTPELPKKWITTILKLSEDYPEPLYWLLISSGYKTYRFLSVFYKEFYPRYDQPTPKHIQRIMNQLAKERFGEDYHEEKGIVRFSRGATPLKQGIADVKPKRLQDEHIKFFASKNPGCVNGDELVCLTVIHPNNFTLAGKRMAR